MAAVLPLAALVTLTSCFQYTPKDCQVLCPFPDGACPGTMVCQKQPGLPQGIGLCAAEDMMCPGPVSDSGVSATDSGTHDAGGSQPPTMLCHNNSCFTLPDSVRSNLVLLLWPSNLPPIGSTVSLWADQSGQGNDAHALDSMALPQVIADGVHLAPTEHGTGFVVLNRPSLDFASGDFALIAVAGLSSATIPVSIARKSDNARTSSRQISIDWVLSPSSTALSIQLQGAIDDATIAATSSTSQTSVAAYTLNRSADHAELHVNGTVFGSVDLPSGTSTTNAEDLYIGVSGPIGSPVDSIEAVIAVRGSIESTVLNELELFLSAVFRGSAS